MKNSLESILEKSYRKEPPQNKFITKAKTIASIVSEKQTAYGNSFGQSGEILRILYPNGIKPSQYNDMLAITRIIDKLFRIATNKDAFGENPWQDICGYALLSVSKEEENNEEDEYA